MSFDLGAWLRSQTGRADLNIAAFDAGSIVAADEREWLITNGLGSFASGSISGANTRRYHGLLAAALEPPTRRVMVLSRVEEHVNGENLATSVWGPEVVSPRGFEKVVAFSSTPVPTWAYDAGDAILIKQVLMNPGTQQVILGYSMVGKSKDSKPLAIDLHFLVNNGRDIHAETKGHHQWRFNQEIGAKRVKIRANDDSPELTVAYPRGAWRDEPDWYWGYWWPREAERGLTDREDLHHAGVLGFDLGDGESVAIVASLESIVVVPLLEDAVREVVDQQEYLLELAGSPAHAVARKLVLAADNFVALRASVESHTLLAGYHWFSDWGRDAMISLPGLTLATGRPDVARGVFTTFRKFLNQGLLPNSFPEAGGQPSYNSADATLWWAWALKEYLDWTGDIEFVKTMLADLEEVVEWYQRGTWHNIRVDDDGLVIADSPDHSLTWMDARADGVAATARRGKPVELSALWYNFLRTFESLHEAAGSDGSRLNALAAKTKEGFQQFWNAERNCLFDVIGTDGQKDSSIRPNQILAVSLQGDLLTDEQSRSVIKVVEAKLLTPFGLRSLAPGEEGYVGVYGGGVPAGPKARDMSYHQGTAWAWLFGPWIDARMRVFGKTEENVSEITANLLMLFLHHLPNEAGLGSVSEIFDGDAPHAPRGCIAQGWSVAELLRVLAEYPELQGVRRELAVTV